MRLLAVQDTTSQYNPICFESHSELQSDIHTIVCICNNFVHLVLSNGISKSEFSNSRRFFCINCIIRNFSLLSCTFIVHSNGGGIALDGCRFSTVRSYIISEWEALAAVRVRPESGASVNRYGARGPASNPRVRVHSRHVFLFWSARFLVGRGGTGGRR